MKLYHYTCLEHLDSILADRELKLTPSNLLKPINLRIVNGSAIDATDSYKPVVWFSTILDFDKANGFGNDKSAYDKTAVAIQIETDEYDQEFCKWTDWATGNGIEKSWFATLKRTAPQWRTFFVTESPVKFTQSTKIIFRPDIMQELSKGR